MPASPGIIGRVAAAPWREELEMEIPYSPQVVDAFMLHTGGSILAAERALEDGVCINMGGGFHHAFPDHGEGFCMINDFAVAIRALQKRGKIRRAMTRSEERRV